MQDFYYNYINNIDDDKAKHLLTSTDSLMHKIEVENIYEDFSKDKELFEFSNFSKDSKYYNNANKVFVRSNSRMHTFKIEENHESEKVKKSIKMLLIMN